MTALIRIGGWAKDAQYVSDGLPCSVRVLRDGKVKWSDFDNFEHAYSYAEEQATNGKNDDVLVFA